MLDLLRLNRISRFNNNFTFNETQRSLIMYYQKEYVCSPIDGITIPPPKPNSEDYDVSYNQAHEMLVESDQQKID